MVTYHCLIDSEFRKEKLQLNDILSSLMAHDERRLCNAGKESGYRQGECIGTTNFYLPGPSSSRCGRPRTGTRADRSRSPCTPNDCLLRRWSKTGDRVKWSAIRGYTSSPIRYAQQMVHTTWVMYTFYVVYISIV